MADSDTTAAADQAASAAARLQQRNRQYLTDHAAFNHNTKALDQAIKAGLLRDAERPPDFFVQLVPGQIPRGPLEAKHQDVGVYASSALLRGEIDLWGPLDVGDRHGFRYMFGAICRATGKAFLQPLRQKSEAKYIFRKFLVLLRAQCPGIEQHLQLNDRFKETRVPGLSVVYTDRGAR